MAKWGRWEVSITTFSFSKSLLITLTSIINLLVGKGMIYLDLHCQRDADGAAMTVRYWRSWYKWIFDPTIGTQSSFSEAVEAVGMNLLLATSFTHQKMVYFIRASFAMPCL